MEMQSSHAIMFNGKIVGQAMIRQEGIRSRIIGEVCTSDITTPFRLTAVCSGKAVVLGVMMPDNGKYTFNKQFTSDDVRRLELYDIVGFTLSVDTALNTNSSASGWAAADDVSEFLEEGEFRRIFTECKELFYCRNGKLIYLAVPINKGEEFPAMPVFCLGEPQKIGGRLCLVFKINDGKLLF